MTKEAETILKGESFEILFYQCYSFSQCFLDKVYSGNQYECQLIEGIWIKFFNCANIINSQIKQNDDIEKMIAFAKSVFFQRDGIYWMIA